MIQATQTLNYEGTFVYVQGPHVEAMRVVHGGGPKGERQRLFSLNGPTTGNSGGQQQRDLSRCPNSTRRSEAMATGVPAFRCPYPANSGGWKVIMSLQRWARIGSRVWKRR